ncbi:MULTISPECIES: hypothetical protein [Cysteiniphilum]|uniref:Uncharacterized protein n=1 Tax=Cysteiniphilum litorale TaxID=2056700 RepID=A0A8J2Z714_9GAMM|nr:MULTISPECIES: hypothetical protein [Cysteiniphilum]GGG08352.1 hypothetical protein GCM10010995_27380 [Cysteiniphilum litorale]
MFLLKLFSRRQAKQVKQVKHVKRDQLQEIKALKELKNSTQAENVKNATNSNKSTPSGLKDARRFSRLRYVGQRFLYYERKVSTVFFWLFVLAIVALVVTHKLPHASQSLWMVLCVMLFLGIGSMVGLRLFKHYFVKYQWQQYLIPVIRAVKEIYRRVIVTTRQIYNSKWFVVGLIVVVSGLWVQWLFAGYRLQPVTALPSCISLQHGWLIGGQVSVNYPQGKIANTDRQTGHLRYFDYLSDIGLSVDGGYRFVIDRRHTLTPTLGFAVSSNRVFSGSEQTIITSLYDISGVFKYHYYFDSGFKLGAGSGLGFVYGWVDRYGFYGQYGQNNDPAKSFYRNITPIFGLYSGYQWHRHFSVEGGFSAYLPYLFKSQQAVYESKSAIPTMYRFSIGVSYVF